MGQQYLVQRVGCSGQSRSIPTSGNMFVNLPNPSIGGNCLVIFMHTNSAAGTTTPGDDQGNTWTAGPTVTDSGQGVIGKIYYALSAAANTQQVTMTFGAGTNNRTSMDVYEFKNITGADVSNSNQGSTSSVTAGNITPTQGNDLVLQYCFVDNIFTAGGTSSFTNGTQANINWQFGHADVSDNGNAAVQYGIYGSTTTINPTMTISGTLSWISLTLALKTGTAGGDLSSGIKVMGVQHGSDATGGTKNYQFPCYGNFIVVTIIGNSTLDVTSITDNFLNTYTATGTIQNGVKMFYAQNQANTGPPITSPNLTMAIVLTGGDNNNTINIYDIQGAATNGTVFDKDIKFTGNQAAAGTLTMGSLTPTGGNALVISLISVVNNTVTGSAGTTGTETFDSIFYDGENGGISTIDQNNGWCHINTDVVITYSQLWTETGAFGNWDGRMAAFFSGPATIPLITYPGDMTPGSAVAWRFR